nr:MAG TPA: hypothetical protein [Caudoviricetes sp.]
MTIAFQNAINNIKIKYRPFTAVDIFYILTAVFYMFK